MLATERRILHWTPGVAALRGPARSFQVLVLAARGYRRDAAGDMAAALAFATLLSLLPLMLFGLLTLGFAGASERSLMRVRDVLLRNFVPDTAGGIQAALEASLEALRDTGAQLGVVGLVLLALTGWKVLGALGRTFDRLGAGETATPLRRAAGLWGTVLVAPLLVAVSLVLTGYVGALTAMDHETARTLGRGLTPLVGLVPAWSALLLAYSWCPARRPPWRSAAAGALAGAVAWEVLKIGFAEYIRRAFLTRTVLAGMGVFPVFLLWLYLSWAVFVYGVEVVIAVEDYEAALRRAGCPRPAPAG